MIHDPLWKVEALSLDVRPFLSSPVLVDSILESIRGVGFHNIRWKSIPEIDNSLCEEVFPYIQS